jgi:hypothetical protein
MNALAALQPFVRAWRPIGPAQERCGVCTSAVAEDQHDHLVDLENRALVCACATCAALFSQPGTSSRPRYRVVPTRVLVDPAFQIEESRWAALAIPVRIAFLFYNSQLARWVALYPSPAGATESELPDAAFRELAAATPLLREVAPDVEALLVYGQRAPKLAGFLVPIDSCYRLVGEVRRHWQGINGGDLVWERVDAFFDDLRARARALVPEDAL